MEQPPPDARNYRFESVEVKEPTFRIDGVFLPPPNASPQIVFFAEVQFQKDELLYHRFFSESLLYLYRNPALYDDWYGIIIFQSRSLEPENTAIHRSLLAGSQVRRIYLDELGNPDKQPVGISLMQLTIAPEAQMVNQARRLIERVRVEETANPFKDEIIEVITTIAVYKFANLSREEVEAMLGVNLEETRVYQEAKEEGRHEVKLELVPRMLTRGMTIEEIAELLNLTISQVQRAAQQESQD
ncbi:hypothetical protein DP113_34000 (plasmid) [Brasilonema octagenarum UFV-E1]|uniref:Flagellar assembly protein H n=2 Tax=Brasilonema TaxID=383614 RepID=A0A856MMT4_9CYAN|nr:Rpn family recombination-promoting nuclease/putative transposase [Brasilonema sennae]NMF66796.1 hypothetical protein [Brasilonema octagenarum UFV-OR1]QDL12745.1 hypothetical protein DP114_33890 [Brasilonema sennae CENA114]QDL19141.1 hypothetical protein DP113_34000 [Brasilonema octagenarum UFV-E1]